MFVELATDQSDTLDATDAQDSDVNSDNVLVFEACLLRFWQHSVGVACSRCICESGNV